MEKLYYYKHGADVFGPMSADKLREVAASGNLAPNDLVWLQGEVNKVPATAVRGLFPDTTAAASSPAAGQREPLPSAIPLPPPVAPTSQPATATASKPSGNGNERMEKAAEFAKRGAEILKTYLARAWVEIKAAAAVTWAQTQRFVGYARAWWQGRTARKSITSAQVDLGKRMYALGVGEEHLRSQLSQLDERVRNVEAAKGSTKLLETERKGLYIRLAEQALAGTPPSGAEAEHRRAVEVQTSSLRQKSDLEKLTANLFPTQTIERVRVIAGYAVCFLVLFILVRWVFSFGDLEHTEERTVVVTDPQQPRRSHPSNPGPGPEPAPSDPNYSNSLPNTDRQATAAEKRQANSELEEGKQLHLQAMDAQTGGNQSRYETKSKEAITHLLKAVRLNPRLADAYLELAKIHTEFAENDKTIVDCTRAIDIDPSMALAWCYRAVAYTGTGDYDKAISDGTEAIRLDANIPLSYIARGTGYMNKSMMNEAILDFSASIALNATVVVAWENRSNCYLSINDNEHAYSDASEAIRLDLQSWVGYTNRAAALINVEQYERALPDIEAAYKLQPNDPVVLANRSRILSHVGRYEEALQSADAALKIDPKNALALANRGLALVGLDRTSEALEAFNESLAINPELPYCYTGRGVAYAKRGDAEQALADFNRALELGPNYIEGYEKRGEFLRAHGESSKAQADFERARQLRG